jgi:hypothetical protein
VSEDLGNPIEELRELAKEPSRGFVGRVHGAIQRRVLAGHLLDLGWSAPLTVLREYIDVLVTGLRGGPGGKEESE